VLNGTVYFGSTKRALAIALSVAGETTEADRLFAQALEENRAQEAHALVSQTKVDWARELLGRGADASAEEGRRLATEALDAATGRWEGIAADARLLLDPASMAPSR